MKGQWISWGLLILAYATFGQLLHHGNVGQSIWLATLGFLVLKALFLTLCWRPLRDLALQGFKSDIGYSLMVLGLASLAVIAVVYFRAFAYTVVLVATALLVRMDCLIDSVDDRLACLILIVLPLVGLGLSWLPTLLSQGSFSFR
jgi:hypothetical protein